MTILATDSDSVRAGYGSWRQQMKSAIRDIDTLLDRLGLSGGPEYKAEAVKQFPVFVPLPFFERIEPGNIDDPLLRQVLPVFAEDQTVSGFSVDPLNETDATLKPGLLQKYQGRVLLITTGACAVHCRYCFRRHFPYQESPNSMEQWQPAINQIEADQSIEEVILSGGDPLTVVDERLQELIERLNQIKHLKRLRVHTRLPIMIPNRITERLVESLAGGRLQPIVVIHSNHANELDNVVRDAVEKLVNAGVTLLNQTVLLHGINDDVEALVGLSNRLMECRVLPYYLHQLDPVQGVAHFQVTKEVGLELIAGMRAKLPGYAVPRYVKEIAGEPNKTVWA